MYQGGGHPGEKVSRRTRGGAPVRHVAVIRVAARGNDRRRVFEREAPADPPVEPLLSYVACKDPRPEVCTRDDRPVCAQRDTGVRCVTTPCDSTEWVTFSSACTACSDPKLLGSRAGPCRKEP